MDVEYRGQGRFWIWSEDLGESLCSEWSAEAARDFARAATEFSNAVPPGLETMVNRRTVSLYAQSALAHVSAIQSVPPKWRERLFPDSMMATRLKRIARLASGSCSEPSIRHLDLNARNLFRVDEGCFAIDWATVGGGSLADELSWLVYGSALLSESGTEGLREIESAAIDGAAIASEGLNAEELRQEMRLAGAARLSSYAIVRSPFLATESARRRAEGILGMALDEFADRYMEIIAFTEGSPV